jgi:hypothetical protein
MKNINSDIRKAYTELLEDRATYLKDGEVDVSRMEKLFKDLMTIYTKAKEDPIYIKGNNERSIEYWKELLQLVNKLAQSLKENITAAETALEMWRSGPFD